MTATSADHAAVLLPPPLIYVLGWAGAWLLDRRWPWTWTPSPAGTIASIALLAVGLILGVGALVAFRKARTSPNPWKPTQTITGRGPYRFTRNPMYVSFAALYAAIGVYTRNGWALLLLPLVLVAVQQLAIVKEEAYLERKFGTSYQEYRSRVRRWL